MNGLRFFLLGFFLICSMPALAAGNNKVDALLKKAIIDSSNPSTESLTAESLLDAQEATMQSGEEEDIDAVLAIAPEFTEEEYSEEPLIEENADVLAEDDLQDEKKELGFKFGSFRLLPNITVEQHYNDNIYASPTSETNDFITVFKPVIKLDLQNETHKMIIESGYHNETYFDNDNDNVDDWYVKAEGVYQATDKVSIPLMTGFFVSHENREDDLTRQLPNERTKEKTWEIEGGIEYKPGKASVALNGHYFRERFDDGTSFAGLGPVIRRDADRATWIGTARIRYDYDPDKAVYIDGSLANREYKRRNFQSGGFNGPFRDSDWYEMNIGVISKLKSFKTDISIGYKNWDYDTNTAIASKDDIIIHADAQWQASDRATLLFNWHRDLYEDDEVVNLIRKTEALAGITYNVNDNLTLGLSGTYEEQKFEGSSREDDTYGVQVSADYIVNQHVKAGLEYKVDSRDSSPTNPFEYDRQIFIAKIRGDL